MNQHEHSRHHYPLPSLAEAWRRHAEINGAPDPATELTSVPAGASPRAGHWPAFYVPAAGELVAIESAQPYPTAGAARDFLQWMLEQLHNNGSITLYPRQQEQAPAREATA